MCSLSSSSFAKQVITLVSQINARAQHLCFTEEKTEKPVQDLFDCLVDKLCVHMDRLGIDGEASEDDLQSKTLSVDFDIDTPVTPVYSLAYIQYFLARIQFVLLATVGPNHQDWIPTLKNALDLLPQVSEVPLEKIETLEKIEKDADRVCEFAYKHSTIDDEVVIEAHELRRVAKIAVDLQTRIQEFTKRATAEALAELEREAKEIVRGSKVEEPEEPLTLDEKLAHECELGDLHGVQALSDVDSDLDG
jgi:hypothetical protein